jgi:hypothetical protein
MKQFLKIIFLALFFLLVFGEKASSQKTPLLKMTAVKAQCQRVGTSFQMILTITLDNWSYQNFGSNIQYTLTGAGVSSQTLSASAANTATLNTHIFQGVNLNGSVTYSITANVPSPGSGGVGGNTLTFIPSMGLCGAISQIVIDTNLLVTPRPCPTVVNLISNGNFMYGNDGTFRSDLTPGCGSCTSGSYCVGKDFNAKCSIWPASTWDHTLNTPSGSYLLIDGHPTVASTVWFANVQVCKGKTYTFSFWAKSLYPDAFNLGIMINNATVPVSTVTLSGASTWRQYSVTWPCTLPTGTIIQLGIRQLSGGEKRDFGIDDVFFGHCCDDCDQSVTEDKEDCIIDIDTTIVKVSCGNIVDIQCIFDGSPDFVKYTLYDSIGQIVFATTTNTTQFSTTLPGTGIFYGVVEVSCGGGDDKGGDEDEDVFEIVNLSPVADFRLSTTTICVNGQSQRNIVTTDYSNQEGELSYLYTVTETSTGSSNTYNVSQPNIVLDAKKAYTMTLKVTDKKGCTAEKTVNIKSAAACKAKFDWWYSWCDDGCNNTKDVTVTFENLSEFANCLTPPSYLLDYGDGKTGSSFSHVYKVPCSGKNYNVKLTITLGKPGDKDYCQATWDTMIVINNEKPKIGISKICCDGLVFFYTNVTKGEWQTPGSTGKPKFPAVSKKIWKPLGIQIGQNYRQYYTNPGTYYVYINGAETENHNRCPIREVAFTIQNVECFNRNVKIKKIETVDNVTVKYKFTALALPAVHRMKSKVSAKGGKKLKEISTDFSGTINKKGADGCFCTPQPISKSSGVLNNKRKAKAATSTSGKFRIGMNKATANFYIKTNSNVTKNWTLQLGFPPCDYPWFLFF